MIYQLRGWLTWLIGCKLHLSVDVYNKGLLDIPSGPHSAFVAIELQNCMHVMFPETPAVDVSRLDGYLDGTENAADTLVGQIDPTGWFRFAGGAMTIDGKSFDHFIYLLGYRRHFVKVQITDLTNGASSSQISEFLVVLCAQMQ